ncbi:hypothetical protein NONO_c57450 [Nocardia nova SH22a]|uniref:Uncharacterized protein n=1 Tax=Nocardia nova SH22a TaxID=1415166 RepID=W5TNH9_9NOCA|nr:hypothetical protein [Nocardia nova]AHH20523.1 hypothetical protein NONO_c57450 [Nocardia nova SH22a]
MGNPADNMDADLPTLDWLAGVLNNHADTIGGLRITQQLNMPDSPVQALSSRIGEAAGKAFGVIGGNFREMAEVIRTTRTSYEELDTAFADQLRRYEDGTRGR